METSRFGTAAVHGAMSGTVDRQRSLVASADAALRTTLGATIRAPQCDGEIAGPRLRSAVRALCDDAHQRGAHAEDVIIAVKQAWAALAELTAQPGEFRRAEILQHFISVCIDEFYGRHPERGGAS